MLSKQQRLTRSAFDQSFKQGKRHHTSLLQVIHDTQNSDFHGAVVVGKKISKKAVTRNRMRRQLYGVLYRHHQNHTLSGTYIVIAKPAAKSATAAEMRDALIGLL